ILKNSALATYDFKSLYKYFKKQGAGKARPAFDCISADYVVSGESGKRSLDKMAKKHLGWSPGSEKPASASAIKETESLVGSKINAVFNIKEVLEKKIKKNKLDELYYKIELPVLKVLAEMEMRGIKADREKLKQVEKEFSGELKKVEENIFSEAGEKFNVNSSKQLSRILFHKLKLKPLRKTATGYSTADDVLEELESAHPLPAMIRRYRGLQKLLSTYIYPLPRSISEETSRINTTFNITGTSTGRLSSTEPNLQNIPVKTRRGTKIRKSFIAEKGNIFLSADYSQIDLRALAHISGDKNLIQSFRRGEDIHRRTAAAVFEVDEDDVDADMRNKAKAVNFGIVYGMSAWGLEKRSDMSKSEAETFIERYFSAYPGVKKYMDEIVEKAGKKKYVTTIFNRRRYLPEINSSNYNRRLTSERMAINTPIQGSSADIIKKAMVRLDRELDFNRGEIKLILQIHDELLFELPLSLEKKARALIKNLMENAARLKVPLPVEFKRGTDWGSLKSC
ncbi:MAG: DNA polymerase I, partial [Elusimicrobiota bacterium]